ncbi:lipid phosphate phosphatase epsilon 2, chloroplastic [Lactuca sativa]|uniref:lipid phosphate phosphatase epsilon 2, chloroplastic n=1 Tax=Lactuca sativa TaxID=4236 RepID=UPI000CD9173C|nr:lipid phosphate phosphatase epsilon 2, chloroplastic [Lactuca sativa]
MVFESIENQEAIGDGGYECNSTSFEQKASIDSNGVSFHRTVGVLHIALNRVSKWCILVSFGGFILLRDDNQALWAVLGSVLNVVLSFTLKKIINQERPVSEVSCGPGMPSSHAQSISFATIFMILSIVGWVGLNGYSAILSGLIIAVGVYFTWLRVLLRYHTISQVVVGAIVGSIFSIVWFSTCDIMVLNALTSVVHELRRCVFVS